LIHGQIKTSKRIVQHINPLKRVACLVASLFFTLPVIAQINAPIPSSVTVQTNESKDSLTSPPVVGNEVNPANAASLFAPITQGNTPKIYSKGAPSGPADMDLRQLWTELKLNNPQLSSLRESYLSAKATVPQINAPANPQVGLVWSGMPSNAPLALGGANAPSPQYPNGISSNNAISVAQPFQFPGKKSLASDIANTNAEALLA
jgi:outer membrane protein, heavy metal efflux system